MRYIQRLLLIGAIASVGMTIFALILSAGTQPLVSVTRAAAAEADQADIAPSPDEAALLPNPQAGLRAIPGRSPFSQAARPDPQSLNWQPWQQLDGTVTSTPAVVSWGGERIDVFARSSSGEIIQSTLEAGRWTNWSTPVDLRNIYLRSAPSCASLSPGTLNCVALREGSGGVM
jgi:hypothetical protein